MKIILFLFVPVLTVLNCVPQAFIEDYDYPYYISQTSQQENHENDSIPEKHSMTFYVKDYYIKTEQEFCCLVVQFNAIPAFKIQTLENPDRLYIDFFNTLINSGVQTNEINNDYIQRVRTGQLKNSAARIVLDTTGEVKYKTSTDENMHRLYVNVYSPHSIIPEQDIESPVEENSDIIYYAEEESYEPAPVPANQTPTLAQEFGVKLKTIIIDPGHGGKDPGATSPRGIEEKDITLDIALRLKDLILDHSEYTVLLTRESDVYVPLEERTAFANRHHGDLFISIHVNAHNSPDKNGIETYFLSMATDEESRALAAYENRSSLTSYSDLQELISKILKNSKVEESEHFAQTVQHCLIKRTNQYNRGVKKAGFVVLIGAQMPSILTEVAFLSNPRGEQLVSSKFYRHMVAEALFKGIISYSEQLVATNLAVD